MKKQNKGIIHKHYADLRRLAEAHEIHESYPARNVELLENDVLFVNSDWYHARYHPNGLVEVLAAPNVDWTNGIIKKADAYPEGVDWLCHAGYRVDPKYRKEYIVIEGNDGVKRYWLLDKPKPKPGHRLSWDGRNAASGLMLTPHPKTGYQPIDPLVDLRITISRKAKTEAMKKWKDFFEWLDVMWDLMPTKLDQKQREELNRALKTAPLSLDQMTSWQPFVQNIKSAESDSMYYDSTTHKWERRVIGTKQRVTTEIEARVLVEDMPFNVERVLETTHCTTDHWEWSLVKRLRAKHRLEELEIWVPK